MIEKIARIDGNEDFDYAKAYLSLDGDKIYVSTTVVENGIVLSPIFPLDENYVQFKKSQSVTDVAGLLELCIYHYSEVVKAMKICEITGEDQNNLGGTKGFNITNW